jgi:hypothetical protein
MTISLSKFKTGARAALVAASLVASVFAMPTAALAQPTIDFGIEFGGGNGGITFGFGTDGGSITLGRRCFDRLTRNEIRRGLRRADFEDIVFVSFTDRRATVEAEWDEDNEIYRIRIDRCDGDILSIRKIS